MKTSDAGLALIREFEGCKLTAYYCPAGVLTIGMGSTTDVHPGQRITLPQAIQRLQDDLQSAENCVNHSLPGVHLTQGEFDALVSFVFNLGPAAFRGSTLYKLLLAGEMDAAAEEFPKWKHAGGKVLPGLVARRAAERALFEE